MVQIFIELSEFYEVMKNLVFFFGPRKKAIKLRIKQPYWQANKLNAKEKKPGSDKNHIVSDFHQSSLEFCGAERNLMFLWNKKQETIIQIKDKYEILFLT